MLLLPQACTSNLISRRERTSGTWRDLILLLHLTADSLRTWDLSRTLPRRMHRAIFYSWTTSLFILSRRVRSRSGPMSTAKSRTLFKFGATGLSGFMCLHLASLGAQIPVELRLSIARSTGSKRKGKATKAGSKRIAAARLQ